jgi:nitrate reductase NapAB chaperone NapD
MRRFREHVELNEAARSRGEEMEHVIIAAFNGKSRSPVSIPISVGKKIKDVLETQYRVKGPASSLGQENFAVTQDWAQFWEPESVPGSTRTPKTDIVLGKDRVSVKMGASQLMSGGINESTAVFYAAADKIRGAKRKMLNEIETQISNLAPSSVAKGPLAGEIKKGKDQVVMAANSAHKVLQTLMRETFETNPNFANYFVHEAITGDVKFGTKSPARATRVLSVNDKGTEVHWYDADSASYLAKVAGQANVTVRFKTTSEKSGGGKTGRYRFWSVVALIVNKMDEEFTELERQAPTLSEGKIKDVLVGIYDKLKNFVVKIWNEVKSFLDRGIKYILEFLGMEPEVSHNETVNF